MRNRLKQLFGTVALVAAIVGLAGRAEAAAIVYVTPTPVIVEVGDAFSIDVFIDADDPVGGYDLDVTWDDAILTANVAIQYFGGIFGAPFSSSGFVGTDQFSASVAGDPLGDNLAALPFRILSVHFTAALLGVSAISIPYVDLTNELGSALLVDQAVGGVVCVVRDKQTFNRAACVVPVPEPGLMVLLATGLATAAVRRRRGHSKA